MMLSCNSQCVEENQQDYPPGEELGLYIHPAFSSAEMVPSASAFTVSRGEDREKDSRNTDMNAVILVGINIMIY